MCGIAGFLHLDRERPADVALLERMTRTLVHRGPDEQGAYAEGPVALGIRRLSIIDVAGGHQPIANEDGSVRIVFNGEIYNFRELRHVLERRHDFRTKSDTEVIVHLYEDYGLASVEALRGMFAFALWDARTRQLLLARDHLGKKPLYYAVAAGTLWFGSELKALLAADAVPRTLDLAALDDYLALGYVPAPRSIFTDVRKLPPGTVLDVRPGSQRERRYWRLDWTPRPPISEAVAVETLRERLEDAVSRRLIADVPLGAFLSGGIDSTTVVWLMSRLGHEPVRTFSIGFDDRAHDESPYAREVARALRTEHYEEIVKPDALALLPKLVEHFDEPFGDSSAIPTYLVSRLAREHVTVVLSGDGGDEAFAGYERYRKTLVLERVRRVLLGAAGTRAAARLAGHLLLPPRRAHRVSAALSRAALPALQRYARMVGLLRPDVRAALHARASLPGATDVPAALEAAWQATSSLDPIRRLQAVDTETYLPDDILVKVDRATMAVSLEGRCPLLDVRLVEYAATLPTSLKATGGVSKRILRRLLEGHVPPSVLTRPKQGFAIPLARWLQEGWRDAAVERLLDSAIPRYFRRSVVERIVAEHGRGVVDWSEPLWLLLVFAAWHDRFLAHR